MGQVADGNAHVRLRPAVRIERHPTLQRSFTECAVASVEQQEVGVRIVRNEQVRAPVLIEVICHDGEPVGRRKVR